MLSMILLSLSLSGCAKSGSDQNVSGGKVKIFVAISSQGDAFRDSLVASIEESAMNNGIEYEVQYAEDSTETQMEQIASAKENGFNVIICRLVDANTALQAEKAADGLPIVFVNNCPSEDRLLADQYVYVGSDEEVAGTYQAEYVLDKLSGLSEINVAILKGEIGHSATKGRTDAAKRVLETSGKQINYVFEDYANWDTRTARDYINIFFKSGGKFDCVIANNDTMALGALAACKDKGVAASDVVVVGVDAIADACASIKNDEMMFTVCQSAKNQGIAAVEVAVLLGSGKSVSEHPLAEDNRYQVWVDFEKVDKSNVDDYM